VWAGRILGTYLHGPALARNPAIADLLLTWVTGSTLDPLDDHWSAKLRAERLAAVRT
jgi:CobQ-like glutamine amidotransferase family enzyme